ncbi:MAG TPA: alpha/beta fold hydrolase [Pyrinomonadaceae bacterium]|jgi:pimeloyl-ACP methyl ester carboxylesterase|nr:alpha/beta fold hydrolase [Pyrinomonadaceae bacterium]
MKVCPQCQSTYSDDTLRFCRIDGTPLVVSATSEAPTRTFGSAHSPTIPIQTETLGLADGARPETHYAKSGDVNIAYQVLGEGPIDLVYVPGWVSHIEYGWEQPIVAHFFRRLGSFSRLILFDKRGTGLSDQTSELPTLEQRMDDVRAVTEAVGSERAAVFGMSEGGNMAMLFAATYPERTLALITFGVFAKRVWDPDYPWAPTPEERQGFYDALEKEWGGPIGIETIAPSVSDDPQLRNWWGSYQRRSCSPRAALALARMNTLIDVRDVLPAIRVPTLVMHRINDRDANIEEGRFIASRIPGAKFLELPGQDHLIYAGDQDSVLLPLQKFLAELQRPEEIDTVLATVLWVHAGSELSADHSERLHAIAARETEWFKGRVADNEQNGVAAIFDGPVRAVRCACAITKASRQSGLATRIGVHTGLCEVAGNKIAGPAPDISRQIASVSERGEVIISNSTRDLVSGSGITFSKDERVHGSLAGVAEIFLVNCDSSFRR